MYNVLEANVERGSSVHPSDRILLVGYLLSHDRKLPINKFSLAAPQMACRHQERVRTSIRHAPTHKCIGYQTCDSQSRANDLRTVLCTRRRIYSVRPSRRLILYLPSLVVFLKATFCYDVNSPLADRAKSAPSPVGHAILEEDACYKDRGLWNCNVECRLVGLAGSKRGQSSASGALGPPR